jgi:hypothetical protein
MTTSLLLIYDLDHYQDEDDNPPDRSFGSACRHSNYFVAVVGTTKTQMTPLLLLDYCYHYHYFQKVTMTMTAHVQSIYIHYQRYFGTEMLRTLLLTLQAWCCYLSAVTTSACLVVACYCYSYYDCFKVGRSPDSFSVLIVVVWFLSFLVGDDDCQKCVTDGEKQIQL